MRWAGAAVVVGAATSTCQDSIVGVRCSASTCRKSDIRQLAPMFGPAEKPHVSISLSQNDRKIEKVQVKFFLPLAEVLAVHSREMRSRDESAHGDLGKSRWEDLSCNCFGNRVFHIPYYKSCLHILGLNISLLDCQVARCIWNDGPFEATVACMITDFQQMQYLFSCCKNIDFNVNM